MKWWGRSGPREKIAVSGRVVGKACADCPFYGSGFHDMAPEGMNINGRRFTDAGGMGGK